MLEIKPKASCARQLLHHRALFLNLLKVSNLFVFLQSNTSHPYCTISYLPLPDVTPVDAQVTACASVFTSGFCQLLRPYCLIFIP
jgi:hypothetical protein